MSSAKYWKLGIIGWPLGYSLSPLMHTAALKAAGLPGEYKEYPVKPENLENWLKTEAPKLDGFNVTMPHKEAVFKWVKSVGRIGSPFPLLIEEIGAVNTVKIENGIPVGENTDGPGFLNPLSIKRLRGLSVLLLGSGGAAQAIAVYLALAAELGSLRIWNRHFDRAERLAKKIEGLTRSVSQNVRAVRTISDAPLEKMDLIVNTTPIGMRGYGDLPMDYALLHSAQIVYDIVYDPRETRLILEAQRRKCQTITGDKMLTGQAAESFAVWTGKRATPEGQLITEKMTEALDEHFAGRG